MKISGCPSPLSRSSRRGFTLPELLVVLAIISVLTATAMMAYKNVVAKAEGVASLGKIKKIGNSLAAYVAGQGTWPQEPDGDGVNSDQLWQWWFKEMNEKQGIQTDEWFSSSHLRGINKLRSSQGREALTEKDIGKDDDLKIPTYVPTKFDYGPWEPFRYGSQPWVVESGEYRTDGMWVYMPDGRVEKALSLSMMNSLRSK